MRMIKRTGTYMRHAKGERGFTLVELLVTVTVIGILSAVVTVGVSGASSTSQTKANQAQFNSVQSGLDTYAASTPTATGVPTSGSPAASATGYYIADGSTAYVPSGTELFINFASTTNSFNTFFRLNNSSATFKCLVATTTTFTLTACKN
jgi:type IV pilus assembly protein PilA